MRAYTYKGEIRVFDRTAFTSSRERIVLSMAEIAKRLGISRTAVYNWEHGKTEPHESHIETLAEILGPTFLRKP